ncbi:MAG: oligosaccharide flippase family protein [Gemmatimonadota bacterium]
MKHARPGARTSPETDTRDLARGAGVNYLGFVARLGARAPFLFLAALLYGEARFGEYTFGITVVETAAALALFGMKRSLFKFMSEAVERGETVHRAVANGVALALVTGTVATLAVGFGAGLLATLFRLPSAAGTLRWLTPALPMIVLSDILLVAIRFTRQMRFEVWARSVAEPITLTTTIVIAYYAGARDTGLFLGYVASLTVAAALSLFFFARLYSVRALLRAPPRWSEMRSLITFSGPTAGYELLILLADKADVFLVTYFLPLEAVGVYGMARQFATVSKKIRQGFDRILPPILSQSIAAGEIGRAREQLCTVSRWILSVQLLIVLGFVFYARDLLGLLGGQFGGGAMILILLLAAEAINGSLGVAELPIVYLRPGANLGVGAAMLVLTLGTGAWLIPEIGPEGAALALVITYAFVNALRIGVNRRLFHLTTVGPSLLKPLIAALPAAGSVLLLQRLAASVPAVHTVLGIPVLIATYVGALVLLGLEPEDRAQLRRLRRRRG